MKTALQLFKFEEKQEIRVLQDDNGDPWFIAKDICEALSLRQVSRALDRLDDDQRRLLRVTHPQNPTATLPMNAINESGMYDLIIRSDKPEAKRLRKWITSEVLPAIRKTGQYSIHTSPARQVLAMAQVLVDIEDRVTRLEQERDEAKQQLLALPEPTVEAPDKPLRAAVNECVRAYAQPRGCIFNDTWNKLYRELKYRAGFDAQTRAKHSGKSALDEVEAAGLLPELYAIAREVLK